MILESRFLPTPVLRRLAYHRRAFDALRFATQPSDRPIRLGQVAASVGMTSCAFSRYFTAKIGMSYSNTLRILRIEAAARTLEERETSISDLALNAGYENCCTFSRAFKSVTGRTPSQYRRATFEEFDAQ